MPNPPVLKNLPRALTALYAFAISTPGLAAKNEIVHVKTTVVLSAPLTVRENDPLPPDIRDLALPVADAKLCKGLVAVPEISLIRADVANSESKPLLPSSESKEKGFFERVADLFGKKPDVKVVEEQIKTALDSAHVVREWVRPGDKPVTLESLSGENVVREADIRFILFTKSVGIVEDEASRIFSAMENTYLAKDKSALSQALIEQLCVGGFEQARQSLSRKSLVFIYRPILNTDSFNSGSNPLGNPQKNICSGETILPGIQFISLAKGAQNSDLRKSNLENAFRLFDNAAKKAESAKACCAKALMNRGVVRDLLKEPNLALDDLLAARRCDSQDSEVHYNLACHYSIHKQLDLALQALDNALAAGFSDCKILREDSDLANLRASPKFKDMLEKHRLFCRLVG